MQINPQRVTKSVCFNLLTIFVGSFILDVWLDSECATARPLKQAYHMDSTLKRRGNSRFHVVSTWNPRSVFVGMLY